MLDTVTREKPPSTGSDLPPLTSGDHLSLAEFERRYRAHPEIKKAELVEGVVYVSSADYIAHARIHSYIDLWLGNYVAQTPGLEIANNLSVLLDLDNEVQPDVCAWRQESPSVTFDAHGMMVGAPDFVGEVAASSAANDLHKKKAVYRRSQVAEYLVLAVYEQAVFWHNLQDGTYVLLQHDANGIYRSRVFPGLWLDAEALWTGDLQRLLATVQAGLAMVEGEG
ncbi:MAG: Uma2 family endonuclease [Anaerolineae bacterium]|nr:Uma2 family endonuclease [Anaerolineae bacterium]MCO5197249.1 Uma2 family endonuclease [Anaerolineae bacterium]